MGDLDLFKSLECLLVDGVDKGRGGAAVVERGGPKVRDLGREFGALAEDGSLLRELELVCLGGDACVSPLPRIKVPLHVQRGGTLPEGGAAGEKSETAGETCRLRSGPWRLQGCSVHRVSL